jgi:TonB-linked SusC/RagA family outer membrane protein
MEKKLTMILACFFLSIGMALAQTKITGTVISSEDGEPVIGASIKVVGTNTGTVTNIDGTFSFSVPSMNSRLEISYIGMTTKTVKVGDNMKIALDPDNHQLDEIVVTALGIKRSAKALGYSATQVGGDQIASARTNDVMSSLEGKVAGVTIANTSSDPGTSNSVVIRGYSSLSGNNQPLYVIDGVPLSNTSVSSSDNTSTADGLNSGFDFGNGANAVNPEDVASLTVLKGAAATALYGSRAANGVILITTKTGSKNKKGIGVEYNGGLQLETLLRIPQMQNEFGMGWNGEKTMIENGSWGPKFDGSTLRWGNVYDNSQKLKSYVPIENNIKDFFDTGVRYSNNVSFNGASDATTYFVSLSQIHEDGIIPTDADSYKKYTFSARASHKIKDLTFSTSLNYSYQNNNFVTTGQKAGSMYNAIMQTPRDISIAEQKDLTDPFNSPGYYYTPYGVTNPYYILNNYQNEYENERFYGKFQLDYDFLKYFRFTYRFGLDSNTGHRDFGQPNMSSIYNGDPDWSDALKSLTGEVYQQTTRQREINQDAMVTFDMSLPHDLHVNAVGGFNGNERKYSYFSADVTNLSIPTFFNLSNSAEKPTVTQYSSLRRLMGVYAQAELSWKDMIYLTATARNDWSSTLPKDNRSFFYPGLTASWVFSELFNEDLKKIITFGKFRAAWGRTGNDANVYMTNSVFAQASSSSSGWGYSTFPFTKTNTNAYTEGNTLGSKTLSPEMTTETELGLNMAFLQNRLSFDLAYYNRVSDKQIFSLDMDPSTGYTAQNINLGKIRNRGIELLVNVTPVKVKDFQWDLSWNFTKNKNKVLSLPHELGGETEIYGLSGGTGLYAVEGGEMGVYKAYVAQKTPDGKIIVDEHGLPLKSEKTQIVGSMNNKYQMGFGCNLKYKSISLAVDFDVRQGGLLYSRTKSIEYFTGNAIQTAYNDRNPWIVPNSVVAAGTDAKGNTIYAENTTALTPTNIYNYWNNGGTDMDAGFLVNKSYVKLRSVVLSWDLPNSWMRHTFLTGVRLSVYGNNLFVWTPSSNTFIDPECTSFGNDLEGNFGEYSANPSSRKFGFNLNVKF